MLSKYTAVWHTGWGNRDGTVVRALASLQCGPGLIPHVDTFVVGSRLCSEGFLRVLRYSSLNKNQPISKCQFDLETVDVPLKSPFVYFIVFYLNIFVKKRSSIFMV